MSIKRIKDLPDGSGNLTNDDIFIFMDNPSGGGITKKISLNQLSASIGGGNLNDIADVNISGVAHNDVLVYNSGTTYWENNNKVVFSNITGITGASGVDNLVVISSGNYASIVSPDPNTLYFVV